MTAADDYESLRRAARVSWPTGEPQAAPTVHERIHVAGYSGSSFLPVTRQERPIDEYRTERYPVPALDPEWDEYTQVQWHVSLAAYDSGLDLFVTQNDTQAAADPPQYTLFFGTGLHDGCTLDDLHSLLTGVRIGAEQQRVRCEHVHPSRARRTGW